MADIISWILISLGCFFAFTGALGIIRMPDVYTRLHAAGLSDSIGAPLILIGFAVQYGFTLVALKIIILALFLLITGPTATHALAKAAILTGPKPQANVIETKKTRTRKTSKKAGTS